MLDSKESDIFMILMLDNFNNCIIGNKLVNFKVILTVRDHKRDNRRGGRHSSAIRVSLTFHSRTLPKMFVPKLPI